MPTTLAIDPGLSHAGLVLMDSWPVETSPGQWTMRHEVMDAVHWSSRDERLQTTPSKSIRRKRKGSSISDRVRRLSELRSALEDFSELRAKWCIEAFAGGRNASAAVAHAHVLGLVVGLARDVTTVTVTAVKRALGCGDGAGKDAATASALAMHPELSQRTRRVCGWRSGAPSLEHVADAVGVFYAALPALEQLWLRDDPELARAGVGQ